MKQVVLITGVAGGIGSATARVFNDAGWHVVGTDRRGNVELQGVTRYIQADISLPDVPERILAEVAEHEGRLDALVNNAAIQICKPIIETTLEDWEAVMASNLRAVFFNVKYAYPLLKESEGAIVNVSSVHAIATSANIAIYATSKGALLALTRAMALEFGPDGIRVNAVLPGAVDTPMLHDGLERGHRQGARMDGLLRELEQRHVLGRVGKPEEIGRAILFLADKDQSSFMTGHALVVDGGATARLSTE
jgi:NAD(P)-dependent dehydrogenase (short-subunit alcohol dehydrogenase family)